MGFLDRFFSKEDKSANTAKNRLQMVLMHDRNDISPGLIAVIKDEIIEVIVHHLGIDPETVDIMLDESGSQNLLVAQVPLTSSRKQS